MVCLVYLLKVYNDKVNNNTQQFLRSAEDLLGCIGAGIRIKMNSLKYH